MFMKAPCRGTGTRGPLGRSHGWTTFIGDMAVSLIDA